MSSDGNALPTGGAVAADSAEAPRRRGLAAVGRRFTQVWYRDAYVYFKTWASSLLPPLIEPFLYLLALGVGLGYYVSEIDGTDYLSFIAPGIVVTTAILQASFECTYGSYFRMAYQSTFDAIISTPINPEEVSLGEICWGATRSFINATAVVIAMAIFGRIPPLWIPVVVALQFVAGLNFGALALTITSKVTNTQYFNFFLSGVIFPVELLTGAYFPLSRLPDFLIPIAWVIPLTSMIDLTRSITLDRLRWANLLELAYILVTTVITVEIALRNMRRRLIA